MGVFTPTQPTKPEHQGGDNGSVDADKIPATYPTTRNVIGEGSKPPNVTVVKLVEAGSCSSDIKKRTARRSSKRSKREILKLACCALVLINFLGIIGIMAVECSTEVRIMGHVSALIPTLVSFRRASFDGGEFHSHRDPNGNIHRTTMSSSDHCQHRRKFWIGDERYDVIHDTRSKWSAVLQHNESRCLLFYMSKCMRTCPVSYPWDADERMGVITPEVARSGSLIRTHDRVISSIITRYPIEDISCTGTTITQECKGYLSFEVMALSVTYMKRRRQRWAPRLASAVKQDQRNLYTVESSPLVEKEVPTSREVTFLSRDNFIVSRDLHVGPEKPPEKQHRINKVEMKMKADKKVSADKEPEADKMVEATKQDEADKMTKAHIKLKANKKLIGNKQAGDEKNTEADKQD